ncbi:MAG: LCP family protein, partial [Actinomycetales bacterium]|nr:LCP family protein [Actinomycetales bacterium]
MVLAVLLAWPIGLLIWANGLIAHTSALTGAPNTPGTTYLLVGSDSRADGAVTDGAEGQRSDSLLVLHRAANGHSALISLPRDTYVQIEGYGGNKINASYAFGGAPLLTSTVEQLTGLTVDHYVEIGMGGVVSVVDAVGGVNLCLDYDVNDELSQLVWTAGCHDVDGTTALAFARMRYSDPLGDIGRQARQRQVIGAIVQRTATPSTLLNPFAQLRIIEAGTGALTTDEETGIVDLARLGLAFRSATGADG